MMFDYDDSNKSLLFCADKLLNTSELKSERIKHMEELLHEGSESIVEYLLTVDDYDSFLKILVELIKDDYNIYVDILNSLRKQWIIIMENISTR